MWRRGEGRAFVVNGKTFSSRCLLHRADVSQAFGIADEFPGKPLALARFTSQKRLEIRTGTGFYVLGTSIDPAIK